MSILSFTITCDFPNFFINDIKVNQDKNPYVIGYRAFIIENIEMAIAEMGFSTDLAMKNLSILESVEDEFVITSADGNEIYSKTADGNFFDVMCKNILEYKSI